MLKLRVSDVNHRTNIFAIKHDDKTETVISFDVWIRRSLHIPTHIHLIYQLMFFFFVEDEKSKNEVITKKKLKGKALSPRVTA